MLELGKKCTGDELIMYANLHFRFWCGSTAPIALPNFMCISGSVLKARHCQRYLIGMSSMGKLEEECKGVADFYDCAAPFVEKDCGQEARSIFTISIVSHGCLLANANFEKDMELLREINSTGKLTMKKAKEFIKNEIVGNAEELSENEKIDPNANCTEAMSDKAINCFLPITDKIQDFSLANAVPIGLPLFNVSGDEISSLCQEYEEVNKNCITKEIQENCAALRIVTFADEILGATCGEMREQPKFTKRIDCIWRQVLKNTPCLSFVQGEIDPIATTSAKCQGMPEFLDCVMRDVIHCGNAAFEFLMEMVDGFGCPLKEPDESIWVNSSIFEEVISSTTSADEGFPTLRSNETKNLNLSSDVPSIDQSFTPIMSEIFETTTLENVDFQMDSNEDRDYEDISKENPGNNEYEEEKDRFKGIKFKDEEIPVPPSFEAKSTERFLATNGLENVELDMQPVTIFNPNCTEEARNRSRTCIAPLMKTWIEIREQRPELKDITFPLFKYTRTELLELCDGYANTFLCAGFESIESCLNDKLVRFAQDHLGYMCSPNNIGNFLRHYDCILEIEMGTPKCREFIKGTLRNDTHKCRGINAYRSCLKARLLEQCTREAIQEFDQSVLQFGCSI
ncbi:unnamed protein product, partial [Mesorhabditis belari]|uniref:DUF19 domain-containing protein n=1 Tax=Mesorhabditis belari TaxID=2138241 RepID=A0AAF3EM74_9BILA